MIVCIGPSTHHVDETVMSLNYGFRAMKIENKPSVNKKVDHQSLVIQLQGELDEKNDQITALEIKVSSLEEQVQKLQTENDELKMYKAVEDSSTQGTSEAEDDKTDEQKEEEQKFDQSQIEQMNKDLIRKKEEEFLAKRKSDLK